MSTIFELLKEDHDRHREMLTKLSVTTGDSEERRELFEAFKIEVQAHAAAEEESLYAEMLADPKMREDGSHSTAEHHEIEEFIEELEKTDMSSSGWKATFDKLEHRYRHHIEEEERDTFAVAKKNMSENKAKELGQRFLDRKPKEKARERRAA